MSLNSSNIENINIDFNLFSLIVKADIVVQITALVLICCSIWSWSIAIEKFLRIRNLKKCILNFETELASNPSMENVYLKYKNKSNNPLSTIFLSLISELRDGEIKSYKKLSLMSSERIKDKMINLAELKKYSFISSIESKVNILASIGSTAPFIGLFGTVWGIMHSFTSIASSNSVSLAVVAPGIAEALFVTALGLFTAIPAVIFYNLVNNEIRVFANKIDNFTSKMFSIISKEIEGLIDETK